MTSDSEPLSASEQPLAERYDVALLDLDGVVYVGPNAVPGVPTALGRARQMGMRLAFVTNNAARPAETVAQHLTELGISASADEVVTSAQTAAHYLARRLPAGSRVLVIGGAGLIDALTERGLIPVASADDEPAAVVQGYSPDVGWRMLAEGCVAINRGVPWVATNLDPTVPSVRGPVPGNGSLVEALRHATGVSPTSTGKPEPTMQRETVERLGARHPLVVGDRLDTDVAGARRVGCPSLLVLSGVTDPSTLLAAPSALRPTYVAWDLDGLLVPHPRPALDQSGRVAQCGRWRTEMADGVSTLRSVPPVTPVTLDDAADLAHDVDLRPGDRPQDAQEPSRRREAQNRDASALDALRALCVLHWRHPELGHPVAADDAAQAVLHRLSLD